MTAPVAIAQRLQNVPAALVQAAGLSLQGRVAAVSGMMVEVAGLGGHVAVGDRITLQPQRGTSRLGQSGRPMSIPAEIVGFRAGHARALAFGTLDGIGPGCIAAAPHIRTGGAQLAVSDG